MKSLRVIPLFVILLLGSQYAAAQRLPAAVVPDHYDLTIDVNLAGASFTGQESIRVEVKSPTADITLNAAEIRFDTVTVDAAGAKQRATVTANDAAEQATFHVERPLQPGPATITIKYTGTLNDQLRGLYLSRANNRRYAVSQLEATDARRMKAKNTAPMVKMVRNFRRSRFRQTMGKNFIPAPPPPGLPAPARPSRDGASAWRAPPHAGRASP